MIKTGIIGGAGYTAGELIRILLRHPNAKISFIHSNSQSGKPISSIHTDLLGDTQLYFTSEISEEVDVYFICRGHGKTKELLEQHPKLKEKKIIDLSRDFRLKTDSDGFVYGLPELNKPDICSTKYIANPGCFATAIQLALLPMASANAFKDAIHIHGITGSTGAGQAPSPTTHFSWRNNNVSVYKAFNHQHIGEVNQSIDQLQPSFKHSIHFVPVRGNFARGIFISAYTTTDKSEEELITLYTTFYKDDPFTHVTSEAIHLKSVVNTNKCLIQVKKHGDQLHVISVIDNLLKGASGQAVQNMNLVFGLKEDTGLHLKSIMF